MDQKNISYCIYFLQSLKILEKWRIREDLKDPPSSCTCCDSVGTTVKYIVINIPSAGNAPFLIALVRVGVGEKMLHYSM